MAVPVVIEFEVGLTLCLGVPNRHFFVAIQVRPEILQITVSVKRRRLC